MPLNSNMDYRQKIIFNLLIIYS